MRAVGVQPGRAVTSSTTHTSSQATQVEGWLRCWFRGAICRGAGAGQGRAWQVSSSARRRAEPREASEASPCAGWRRLRPAPAHSPAVRGPSGKVWCRRRQWGGPPSRGWPAGAGSGQNRKVSVCAPGVPLPLRHRPGRAPPHLNRDEVPSLGRTHGRHLLPVGHHCGRGMGAGSVASQQSCARPRRRPTRSPHALAAQRAREARRAAVAHPA